MANIYSTNYYKADLTANSVKTKIIRTGHSST